MTGPDKLLYLAIGSLALSIAGLAWAVRTLYFVGRDRKWSLWVAAAPFVVISGVAVALAFPPRSFDEARPELEKVAQEMLKGPDRSRNDLTIGGLDISLVIRGGNGSVFFYDADGYVGTFVSGWIFSPNVVPESGGTWTFEMISEDWYKFSYRW
ncbi:DUF1109 domain-containing protein [Rhodococcus spongiicola]|nr:DUF1109 domain-containing protein [Rhodococcus spongiicola]